jgi:hypothetical protein
MKCHNSVPPHSRLGTALAEAELELRLGRSGILLARRKPEIRDSPCCLHSRQKSVARASAAECPARLTASCADETRGDALAIGGAVDDKAIDVPESRRLPVPGACAITNPVRARRLHAAHDRGHARRDAWRCTLLRQRLMKMQAMQSRAPAKLGGRGWAAGGRGFRRAETAPRLGSSPALSSLALPDDSIGDVAGGFEVGQQIQQLVL